MSAVGAKWNLRHPFFG